MTSGFDRVPLADVLEFREGPGIMAADFVDEGVPLIRLSGLKDGAGLLNGCNYLSPDKVDVKWRQFRLREGDVLLSTSASLGEVAVVGTDAVRAIPYTGIISFRPKGDRIDRRLIRYLFKTKDFLDQIEAMGVGSVMRHFGPSHLRQMWVTVPPLTVQGGISDVLGALDGKIAANRKLIEKCDTLSSTMFDFMRLGQELPLSSVARFVNGKAFTKGASGSGRVVVRISELNSGPGASTVYNDIDVDDDNLTRPGDLLFSWSGSLVMRRWFYPEAIVNQHIFKVIPNFGFPKWLVAQLISKQLEYFRGIAADKTTTMGHIQRRHLDEPVEVPHQVEIVKYDPLMTALWDRALAAEQESLTLAALRDTLLPALMSGRLSVRDAEAAVSEVV